MVYNPPNQVTAIEFPYLSLVTKSDPNWSRDKYWAPEYQFSNGRTFMANPYVRGSFTNHSNVYPVGQPYGGNDPLIIAARPMYSGTPTGGWA